jgi:class 3 adenylate cyclase
MDYVTILAQVLALLQQEQRLSYRVLKRRFQLDDDLLEDLKEDLIYAKQLAIDEDGRVLVWTGGTTAHDTSGASAAVAMTAPLPDAERRQLTVLFCDLVDSTALARQLDPEDLREVVRAYQDTCAKVIARFEGYIAQYLGDGLLVYFGYPLAHEDDAQRAVRAGLGMVDAVGQLNTRLAQEQSIQLAVRLGVHTGLVVVGEVGSDTRQEQLALGETPNIAARLQGLAAPNTLVASAATFQLLGGFFACQPLGTRLIKGLTEPLAVYRVLYESMARSRLEAAGSPGLTPWWAGSRKCACCWSALPRQQAVEVIRQVAHGKALPPEVVEQIVAKTDGVPLFVEELTKMALESERRARWGSNSCGWPRVGKTPPSSWPPIRYWRSLYSGRASVCSPTRTRSRDSPCTIPSSIAVIPSSTGSTPA